MQPSGRGGNFRSFNPFMSFLEPLAFGRQMADFSDFFGTDSMMSDPFLFRPFGGLMGSTRSPFGSSDFFGDSMFRPPFGLLHQARFPGQFSVNVPVEGRRGPVIEELPDDHDVSDTRTRSNQQQPIIEHPDDDVKAGVHGGFHSRHMGNSNATSSSRMLNRSPVQSYTFQSSTVTYGGANGPMYTSQSTMRQGPGGIFEENFEEKDSISGKETKRTSKAVDGKGRSVTRKRNADGQENTFEVLHNLESEELPSFERTWQSRAEKSLPRWNKSRPQLHGSSSKLRAALPSNVSNSE